MQIFLLSFFVRILKVYSFKDERLRVLPLYFVVFFEKAEEFSYFNQWKVESTAAK